MIWIEIFHGSINILSTLLLTGQPDDGDVDANEIKTLNDFDYNLIW